MKPALITLAASLALVLSACSQPDRPANPEPAPTPAPAPVPAPEPVPEDPAQTAANPSLTPDGMPIEQPITCREERGDALAQKLVDRCIAVSPATHPPCNVQNPCLLIEGEIERSCAQYGPGETRPAQCSA
ncbi:hypothetical protein [Brevundimonas vesicularis]|uniref:hypothetical protein n=1 Tax=Brevundimonas vesicularis TaxID=41276 RepID=UPI0038D4989C